MATRSAAAAVKECLGKRRGFGGFAPRIGTLRGGISGALGVLPPEIEREEGIVRLHLEGARLHIQAQGEKLTPGCRGAQRCLELLEMVAAETERPLGPLVPTGSSGSHARILFAGIAAPSGSVFGTSRLTGQDANSHRRAKSRWKESIPHLAGPWAARRVSTLCGQNTRHQGAVMRPQSPRKQEQTSKKATRAERTDRRRE